jgi:hypothetical protein
MNVMYLSVHFILLLLLEKLVHRRVAMLQKCLEHSRLLLIGELFCCFKKEEILKPFFNHSNAVPTMKDFFLEIGRMILAEELHQQNGEGLLKSCSGFIEKEDP